LVREICVQKPKGPPVWQALFFFWLQLGNNASAGEQMEDPNHQSNDKKRMDQASANMERESEQPHDYQDRSNRKQHIFHPRPAIPAVRSEIRGAQEMLSN
jgi:hypothetical protein